MEKSKASPSNTASPQDSKLQTDHSPLIMPAQVRAGQVIGLVEVTGGLGSPIDVSRLADEFGNDLTTLLPILDTGELLGLVKTEKGDVWLTEFGVKFQKTSKNKVRLLKDQLSKIEPFKTAISIVNEKGTASVHEIADSLQERDIRWHHKTEMNEQLVAGLLIHWAIYAGLLSYDGKRGKFAKGRG